LRADVVQLHSRMRDAAACDCCGLRADVVQLH